MTLVVSDDMVNFHGSTHGGVIFSLGDIAFAAASNSHGQKAVALNVGIYFLKETKSGDRLIAEATEQSNTGPIGLYDITIKVDRTGEIVAKSHDLVYRKKEWFVPNDGDISHGRNSCYQKPPAQTRTCGFLASGSSVVLTFAPNELFMPTPCVVAAFP